MDDLHLNFEVARATHAVFDGIVDVRGWWYGTIEGSSDHLGDEFTYRYEDVHYSRLVVSEFGPGECLVWRVTEADLSFVEPRDEWVGTDVVFALSETATGTRVDFTHVGLTPSVACFGACSEGWGFYAGRNLPVFLEIGRGLASPWAADT